MAEDIRDRMDLGTWGTFRAGWWVLHAFGILIVGFVGYWLGNR